jgi:CBS domain-containing protein
MRVQDIMTTDVVTARPDTSLKEVARMLVERGISGMPIVDNDGSVFGVISESDVIAKERPAPDDGSAMARLMRRIDIEEQVRHEARTAGDAMSSPPITVQAYWTIPGAAALMREHAINRLPVVRQGRLIGIVTRADLVRAFARSDEEIAGEIRAQVALQDGLWNGDGAVEVDVQDGETTLSGSVRRRIDAEVLPKLVAGVPGVVGVHSKLTWTEDF